MSENITAPVVGLDNVSPLYNPNGKWQIWNIDEIYLGNSGAGKYIPKVKDLVCEITGRIINWFIVHSIDPVTFVPELLTQDNSKQTDVLSNDDILYGVGPGTQSDTYRVYLDKSVMPYRLSVDRRLKVGGSTCEYCKIFKGADTSEGGIVISGRYDSNGTLLSENIPLETVATTSINNASIKVVSNCFTIHDLNDGELVTAVLYDSNGYTVSKRQLLIENTGFIRSTDSQKRYVSGISLETPFLSSTNNKLIQYPINVPLNSMNLMGVVHYSDGSFIRLAIDGTKFSLLGLENYSATIVGQNTNLVLKYKLDDNEEALNVHTGSDTFITELYEVMTIAGNGHYAVQLFVYPEWISSVAGYKLRWFMYDLDRTTSYEVTPNVIINSNLSSFNPTLYGTKQTLHVSINLRAVNGSYTNFNHVQIVDVILNKEGVGRPTLDNIPNWLVTNISNEGNVFGNNIHSTYKPNLVNEWGVRIAPSFSTQGDWLNALYKLTQPMFDPDVESAAPIPTHFILVVGNSSFEYPISKWNTELKINQPVTNNGTVFIKFIKRTVQRDLQLAIAGTPIFQVDINGSFI